MRLYMRICLALLLAGRAATAQEERPVPPEVVSEATPEVYRDAEAGFSLRLAGGFRFLTRQEALVLFGSKVTPGVVFLQSGETFTEQELLEAARSGYHDEGVALTPEGPPSRLQLTLGKGLAFAVRGTLDNQPVRGMLAGVRSNVGRCFIVLVATTPEAWDKLAASAERIIQGIGLFPPEAPPVDRALWSYFAGQRLSFYFSRQSYSAAGSREGSFGGTERIYLCSDGSFVYGEQSRASFDVPQAMGYSRTGNNSSGRWSVAGGGTEAILLLQFHDGKQWRYRATRMSNDLVYLNGSKYFRARQTQCR